MRLVERERSRHGREGMYLIYTLERIGISISVVYLRSRPDRHTSAQIDLVWDQSSPSRDVPRGLELQCPEYDDKEQHHTGEEWQSKHVCSQPAQVELRQRSSHVKDGEAVIQLDFISDCVTT